MTETEFLNEFREQFNLASQVPVDIFESFAESVGIKKLQGEMNGDFLDRLARYLKNQYRMLR